MRRLARLAPKTVASARRVFRAWPAAALAAAMLVSGCADGCQRKPRFVTSEADSASVEPDSLEVRYREVQRAWEAGMPDDEAAASTAKVLRDALSLRAPADWPRRAQRLLDSLGVGSEISWTECAMVINMFARSDPEGRSWPCLYWCGPDGPRFQSVEGKGLRLSALSVRGLEKSVTGGRLAKGTAPGAAALFHRRAASGLQPMLFVWEADTAVTKWRLAQTLGPDSLGGVGTGEFAGADDTIELTLRTYSSSALFDECPTCPHVYRLHRFRWEADGFTRTGREAVPSPYSTFVQFIQALASGDHRRADELVSDPALSDQARDFGWASRSGKWRIEPGIEETPERMVFYRGEREAYAVHFASGGGEWVITAFEPVDRTLE